MTDPCPCHQPPIRSPQSIRNTIQLVLERFSEQTPANNALMWQMHMQFKLEFPLPHEDDPDAN